MKKIIIAIGAIALNYMADVSAMSQYQMLLEMIDAKLSYVYIEKIKENERYDLLGEVADNILDFDADYFNGFDIAYRDIFYPAIMTVSNNINVDEFIYDNFMIFNIIIDQYIAMAENVIDNDNIILAHKRIRDFFLFASASDDFKKWFCYQLSYGCEYDNNNIFNFLSGLRSFESRSIFCSLFEFSEIIDNTERSGYEQNFNKLYKKYFPNFGILRSNYVGFTPPILEFINVCEDRARDILFFNGAIVDCFCKAWSFAGRFENNQNLKVLFEFMRSYDFDNTMELFNNEVYKGNFIENLLYVIRLNTADGPCKGVMQHVLSSGRKAQVFRDYLLHICDKDAISSLLPLISHAAVVSQNSGGYSKHSHDWIIDAEIASYDPVMYQELFLYELFK